MAAARLIERVFKKKSSANQVDFTQTLPPELLLYIFSFITVKERMQNASLVCWLWKEFCNDSLLNKPDKEDIEYAKKSFAVNQPFIAYPRQRSSFFATSSTNGLKNLLCDLLKKLNRNYACDAKISIQDYLFSLIALRYFNKRYEVANSMLRSYTSSALHKLITAQMTEVFASSDYTVDPARTRENVKQAIEKAVSSLKEESPELSKFLPRFSGRYNSGYPVPQPRSHWPLLDRDYIEEEVKDFLMLENRAKKIKSVSLGNN